LLESIERIPGIDTSRGAGRSILGRAYLNRSHAALKAGDANLASHCLGRALAISPGTWSTIAFDPRLALQMAVLKANPTLAVRWFAKRNSSK
jgi:hypothetical protein